MITFTVPLEAVGQPRYGKGKNKNSYIPRDHKIHSFKEMVRFYCPIKRPQKGKFLVGVKCYMQRPKNDKHLSDGWDEFMDTPDADNIFKAVTDSLKGQAWRDDRQCDIDMVRRFYTKRGEQPRFVVTITSVLAHTMK